MIGDGRPQPAGAELRDRVEERGLLPIFVDKVALQVEARYAFWIWPLLCVFAGWFVVQVMARLRSGAPVLDPGRRNGLRWAAGAVLALLLVWFAFAGPHLDRMCT